MKKPQLEDGYIRIANDIWKKMGSFRISGEEWRVLTCVLAKTYGFNKKRDSISLSQFVEWTGMKKPSVVRAINKLINKNIVSKEATPNSSLYCFNKLIDTWRGGSKKATGVAKKIISVSKDANLGVAKRLHTKDTYTKDTYTKDTYVGESDLIAFLSVFNEMLGTKYRVTDNRKRKLKERLKTYSLDEILLAIKKMSSNKFYLGKGSRGWKANPDFFLRNDEKIDEFLNINEKKKIDLIPEQWQA